MMTDDPTSADPRGAFERVADRTAQRRRERSHRRQRTGFRIHATVFVAVQVAVFAIWLTVSRTGGTSYPWFVFPLVAGVIGLAAHFSAVAGAYRGRSDR